MPADVCVDDQLSISDTDDPGRTLQRQRERHGLTIDDVARTTKISKTTLRAIEANDLSHLPAPIYTRGFVKAYASEVGLNPQRTADNYLSHLEPAPVVPASSQSPSSSVRRFVPPDANDDVQDFLAENQVRRVSRLLVVVGAAALLVYLVSFNRGEPGGETPALIAEDAAGDLVLASSALGEEALALDASPASFSTSPLRIELTTRAQCWVSARVDGARVLVKLLPVGAQETLQVHEEMLLRIGEPGALSLSINGEPGRPLGPAGQPITVRITRDNFRQFLGS